MALIEDEQAAGRRKRRGGVIPTTPDGPRPGGGGSGGSGGGGSTGGGGTSGGGGTKPADEKAGLTDAEIAQNKADAEEAEYRRKAGNRYLSQAANLEAQARSLQYALKNSYGDALRQKLQNVNEILQVQDKTLMQGYRKRVGSLQGALDDNEKASSTQSMMNEGNRVRERSDALNEIALQGAGETDNMAAQLMSLRNWQANESEVKRAEFDTLRSINSSLTDLNVDTKAGRINLEAQSLADKELLWTNYYNQRGESLTALGNIRGQQADYRDMAKEYGVGGGGSTGGMEKAYMAAAKTAGKAWDSPGISKNLRRWDGRKEFEGGAQIPMGAMLKAGPTVNLGKKPEGATLREW